VGGGPALVLHVWTDADANDDPEGHAQEVVDEGVRLARGAGFDAEALALRTFGEVPAMIVDQAELRDAPVVVMGSRGLSDYTAALLGSVSTSVLHTSPRPVLVIPNGRA
jgi:nucleotide-binding universal stress UspA family protein